MTQLDLALPTNPGPGRPPKTVLSTYMRDLTPADVAFVLSAEKRFTVRPLQRLRAIHHNVALLLARGEDVVKVSKATGFSPSYIRHLDQNDPAFQELVASYRSGVQAANSNMIEQLSSLGEAAIAELQERLASDPGSIPVSDLRRIIETAADRSGFGPTKTVQNLNTSDAIRELVKRKEDAQQGRVIDVSSE